MALITLIVYKNSLCISRTSTSRKELVGMPYLESAVDVYPEKGLIIGWTKMCVGKFYSFDKVLSSTVLQQMC